MGIVQFPVPLLVQGIRKLGLHSVQSRRRKVMSVRALGTSLKLSLEGNNQLIYPETWFSMIVVATCVVTEMYYLNKALHIFNTAIVSPMYYVMFTSLTIVASVIMFEVI